MKKFIFLPTAVLLTLILAACSGLFPPAPTEAPEDTPIPASPTEETASPEPTSAPENTESPVTEEPGESAVDLDERPPIGAESEYLTDFSRHSVPYSEILTLLRKDSIPAIDDPTFVSVEEADGWLGPFEPVIHFQLGDDSRAYPLQIFMWHEIVNDVVDGVPVVITFCPLCNTAIAFESTVNGQVLDFGTTGRLRYSNLIMYDRPTETWWQQATGEAIVGELLGTQLAFLPAPIIGWSDFKKAFPEGQVLSRDTGYNAPYGQNPYEGYDDVRRSPFAYEGPATPGRLQAMARVLTVDLNGEAVAYPYDVLAEVLVVNDIVGGQNVVVFWQEGANSALDQALITTSRDVGAANSFSPLVKNEPLTFTSVENKIFDDQTGSEWNILGLAIAGPLEGTQLERVVGVNHFWFSWAAFRPDTRVYQAEG